MAIGIKPAISTVINRIPVGMVASYGQIAKIVQGTLMSRVTGQLVGWQLSAMRREEWETLPWWRVVNKKGVISAMKLGQKGIIQKQLLEAEGVVVEDDTIDMEKYNVGLEELSY